VRTVTLARLRKLVASLDLAPGSTPVYVCDDAACGDETPVLRASYRKVRPEEDAPAFKAIVLTIE
jgi:hypothetical protein